MLLHCCHTERRKFFKYKSLANSLTYSFIFDEQESNVQELPFPPLLSLTPSLPTAFVVVGDLLRGFAVSAVESCI